LIRAIKPKGCLKQQSSKLFEAATANPFRPRHVFLSPNNCSTLDLQVANSVFFVLQAPPPPPGVQTRHYYDPVRAPPPPPGVKRASLDLYVRKEVRPRVVAICEGGLEGVQHQSICMAVAESLGKYQPITGYGLVAPFCERICWHSCNGESHAGGRVRPKPARPIARSCTHPRTPFRRRTTASTSARARAARRTRASTSCCGGFVPLGPYWHHISACADPCSRALPCAGSARP